MAKRFEDMDLSEKAEFMVEDLTTKDALITALVAENADLKAQRDALLKKLEEKAIFTKSDSESVVAKKAP